jgi:acetoin utilization deacetylase AcuC-like enzyme
VSIPIFFHKDQLDFHPKYEWALGNRIDHPETTKRAQSIFHALENDGKHFSIQEPSDIPLQALRRCHNYNLITLYNTAKQLEGDFYPSVFPQRMKANPDPTNINHAGFYCFDSGTPLNNKTWSAAAWSAATAHYAAKSVAEGSNKVAYALSRPPGHHASKDTYGGYCYFNNAAIAAKVLRDKKRVAIVDIDFHHGNGIQEIFYEDDRVMFISIHGDPRNYFPYFCGFPTETGRDWGTGFNQNIILPDNTEISQYLECLDTTVIPAIEGYEPHYLIISAGFDTYHLDPIGKFALTTSDYEEIAKVFSRLNLPTVVIQEGGYFTKDLGDNVASFLHGFL